MAFVAIEFEANQLMVAAAQKSGKRSRITGAVTVDVAGLDDEAAGRKLESALCELGAAKSDTVAIVSRSMAEIRELTVPPAPDNELPDMIRFQARNEFAALNDQWKLDYVPLTDDPDSTRKVLAAAISPQLESRIETICKEAGVKLKRIVLRPYATVDLLKSKLAAGREILIVDQNIDSTDLSVVKDGRLLSTRTARLPEQVTPEQRSQQLLTEVRRTLASYKMSSGGESIDEVVVSGEEARNRHLKGNLESKLKLKVSFINPFDLVESNRSIAAIEEGGSARFASVLGALLTEVEGETPKLDFINYRKTEIKKTDYSKLYFYGALAASIAIFGAIFGWWVLRSQANEIETARSNLRSAIELNAGNDRFPSVDQKLNEVKLIDQWKMQNVNWLTELSSFSDRYLLPDDVIADSMTASLQRDGTGKITLKGRIVEELSKTDQLIKALRSRPYKVETMDTGTVAPDQKSEYPSTFEYHLGLPATAMTNLNSLNRRATAFMNKASETTTTAEAKKDDLEPVDNSNNSSTGEDQQ